jgi:hypothetical protein
VALVKLDGGVFAAVMREIAGQQPGAAVAHAFAATQGHLSEINLAGTPRILAYARRAPGLATSTRHPESDLFVGLHVDSMFNLPPEQRHRAPNRIAINVGSQTRYLLFLPALLHDVRRALGIECGNASELVSRYMAANVRTPVFRLAIEPGEAYVAPTEQLIHDSTTQLLSAEDLCLHACGYFSLGRLALLGPDRCGVAQARVIA